MLLPDQFNSKELRLLRSLKTPARIQRFLDREVAYNGAASCLSVRSLLDRRRGHCMEGSLLAAAALELLGHPPLLVDLEAVRDDDHVLAVFREGGYWGAIAKSNYSGLRFREPVYRSIRELAMSYFEHYFNLGAKSHCELTLVRLTYAVSTVSGGELRRAKFGRYPSIWWRFRISGFSRRSRRPSGGMPTGGCSRLDAWGRWSISPVAARNNPLRREPVRFRSPRAPHEPAWRGPESSPDSRPAATPI